jgi:hypothetical protein
MPAQAPLPVKQGYKSPPINTSRPMDRRPSVLGRLVSLSSTNDGVAYYLSSNRSNEASSSTVIAFPSMPEVIELAREADYRQTSAPYTPDGIHLYKKTNPLSIPISFSLHYQDPFCSQGGLSLLLIAAKLHSLILPINNSADRSNIGVTVGHYYSSAATGATGSGKAPNTPEGASAAPTGGAEESIAFNNNSGQASTVFPPACLLDLISVGDRNGAPGIRCYGYVRSVNVKLKGPWMRGAIEYGPDGIRNVPTSAEFSFVFVHAPGFSNYFGGTASSPFQLSGLSAFAQDVLGNLYNTVPLTQGQPETNRYIGIGENPNNLNQNTVANQGI